MSEPTALAAAMVAARFASEDAARMAWLDEACKREDAAREWVRPAVPVHTYTGICALCGTTPITERNKTKACRVCWHRLSPARRRAWKAAITEAGR